VLVTRYTLLTRCLINYSNENHLHLSAIYSIMEPIRPTGGFMNYTAPFARIDTLIDDTFVQHPDSAEQTVLRAVRTWLRPHCDAHGRAESWRGVLAEAGLAVDGLGHFDLLMGTLCRASCRASCRPLDTRCRCASELAKDEGSLLQVIALLQSMRSEAAVQLLNDWLPMRSVSGMLKTARWFAIALLDAGLRLSDRVRRVTYMH
jgi:hypothetical protein